VIEIHVFFISFHNEKLAKLSGLFLYASRLIRPIWNSHLTKSLSNEPKIYFDQEIMWNDDQRKFIQYKLMDLRQFIKENYEELLNLKANFTDILPIQQKLPNTSQLSENIVFSKAQSERFENLIIKERNRIENLQKLIIRIIEALELISFFDDQKVFSEMQAHLTYESMDALEKMIFKELFSQQISIDFIISLFGHYLNLKKLQGINTLRISEDMLQKAATFYTTQHFLVYKAEILLEKAGSLSEVNKMEQIKLIKEAENILFNALELVDIERVGPLFLQLNEFAICIKLALAIGETQGKIYMNETASFYREQADEIRKICYSFAIKLLEELHYTILYRGDIERKGFSYEQKVLPINMKFPGCFDSLTYEQLIELENTLINESIKYSKDEIFHLMLFNLLKETNMIERLMKLDSPYLENYIKNEMGDINNTPSEFSYHYYMIKNNYRKAADILIALSQTKFYKTIDGNLINLEDRLNYLTTAQYCINKEKEENKPKDYTKIQEYENQLEFLKKQIRLQQETIKFMQKKFDKITDEQSKKEILQSIEFLKNNAIDNKTLLIEYAEKYELWEIALKIKCNFINIQQITEEDISTIERYYELLLGILEKEGPWPDTAINKLTDLSSLAYNIDELTKENYQKLGRVKEFGEKISENLFPIESIVFYSEMINCMHFVEIKEEINSLEEYINRPEFWVIHFLRSAAINLPFEEIYSIYEKILEKGEKSDIKWILHILMSQLICCSLWNQRISKKKYDPSSQEHCKELLKKTIKRSQVFFSIFYCPKIETNENSRKNITKKYGNLYTKIIKFYY